MNYWTKVTETLNKVQTVGMNAINQGQQKTNVNPNEGRNEVSVKQLTDVLRKRDQQLKKMREQV